ncbi:hypothetical protein [Opitutus sp. ER46]|uniref:hypothetical protein n=1 Tax=Opitutus sp. ER46 TaxID=2161864 RepID=UPI0011B268B2|nr:hypothetical protein [Opitutus sp. ER46]
MKTIGCICVLVVISVLLDCRVAGAGSQLRVEIGPYRAESFDWVTLGTMVIVRDPLGDGCLLYRDRRGEFVMITRNILGVAAIVNAEVPVSERLSFIRSKLLGVLSVVFPNPTENTIDDTYMRSRSRQKMWPTRPSADLVARSYSILQQFHAPRLEVDGNRWIWTYYVTDEEGGVASKMARGDITPFSIAEVRTETVIPAGTIAPTVRLHGRDAEDTESE